MLVLADVSSSESEGWQRDQRFPKRGSSFRQHSVWRQRSRVTCSTETALKHADKYSDGLIWPRQMTLGRRDDRRREIGWVA